MRFCMKQHEREYFISRIREGKYRIELFGKRLEILSPTIEDEYYINQAYIDGLNSAERDGFKTNDEMISWMIDRNLWSHHQESDIDTLKKKIESLKIDIYNSKNKKTFSIYYKGLKKLGVFKVREVNTKLACKVEIEKLISYLNEFNKLSEGMHVIEHILLRPQAKDQYGFVLVDDQDVILLESYEFGETKGLDIIKGTVNKFLKKDNNNKIKIPFIGWNTIRIQKFCPIFK